VNRLAQPPPVPKAKANLIAPLGSVEPDGPAAHD
jgi:hypothetical protein